MKRLDQFDILGMMLNQMDNRLGEEVQPNHLIELEAEGFKLVDSLSLATEGDGPNIKFAPASKGLNPRHPSVYAWVACSPGRSKVIYVGMASQGWRVRRSEHAGGLKATVGAGAKNRNGVIASLEANCVVKVLERRGAEVCLFGIRAQMHGAEEWALIARFRPPLNKPNDIMRAVQFTNGSGADM